jgi:hypothetical protein
MSLAATPTPSPSRVRLGRSAAVGLALAVAVALTPASTYAQGAGRAQPQPFQSVNVLPITITSVTPDANGQLMANGVVGTNRFSTPITMTAQPGGVCPILNLQLGPINLSLLGLDVDTSPICLRITALQSQGLLGDLLCSIANLLSGDTPLAGVLGGLDPAELDMLDAGLTTVLNQAVFTPLTSSQALVGASCDILNLSLGPVDLFLLGLRVELDDCADGPVTVDITARPGGGLLGDLLCNLTNLLNNPVKRLSILRQIAQVIGGLLATPAP